MMERPTCETCIHWYCYDDEDQAEGFCVRLPPVMTGTPGTAEICHTEGWGQPITHKNDRCSEHHNFPAYLAWFREQGATPKPPTAEPEYLSGDDLAKRIGRSKQTVQSWARLQKIGRVRGDRCWLYSVDDAIRYMARDPLRVAAMADKAEALDHD